MVIVGCVVLFYALLGAVCTLADHRDRVRLQGMARIEGQAALYRFAEQLRRQARA